MTDEVNQEVVDKALAQGWADKEQWKGSPDSWVDAETFVRRGEEIMPILRKNNESLLHDLKSTKEQLAELKAASEEWKKFQKEATARQVTELETQIVRLKELKAEAIKDGDGDKVNAIDDSLDALKLQKVEAKKEPEAKQAPSPEVDPELRSWMGDNPWFGSDDKKTGITNAIANTLRKENPYLVGRAFLNKLDQELSSLFEKATPRSPVEGSGGKPRASSGKKSYENLPADARAAADRFVKQGLMTKEEYLSSYDWD
jgi:hypothetical protein